MWFSSIRSPNLQLYLRGVRILEEKGVKRARLPAAFIAFAVFIVEGYRIWWMEEWERNYWTPEFVMKSRREHYVNEHYNRLKLGLETTFEITNWEKESKMVYHVDTQGNHRYEKIILPAYHYGKLESPEELERFYRLSVYNMNKDKRNDLDNFLRAKTITLGDWLIAIYYLFNVKTQSFDPFFYKPEIFYQLDRESLFLNFQTSDKPRTILRVLQWAALVVKNVGEFTCAPKNNT
jgi:hypothetical protein